MLQFNWSLLWTSVVKIEVFFFVFVDFLAISPLYVKSYFSVSMHTLKKPMVGGLSNQSVFVQTLWPKEVWLRVNIIPNRLSKLLSIVLKI